MPSVSLRSTGAYYLIPYGHTQTLPHMTDASGNNVILLRVCLFLICKVTVYEHFTVLIFSLKCVAFIHKVEHIKVQ